MELDGGKGWVFTNFYLKLHQLFLAEDLSGALYLPSQNRNRNLRQCLGH